MVRNVTAAAALGRDVGPPAPCLGRGCTGWRRRWTRTLAATDWDGLDVDGVANRWACSCGRLVEVIEWRQPVKSAVPAAG